MSTNSRQTANHYRLAVPVAILLGAIALSAQAQPASIMDSTRTEVQLQAGQRYSGTLKLKFPSENRATWHGEVRDFDATANPAVSCKEWLKLDSDLVAETNGSLSVPYTLNPPADISVGSYVCEVRIELKGAGRFVEEVDVTVGSSEIEGRPKQIQIESVPGSSQADPKWQAVVVMENKGKMYYRPSGKLEILDVRGNVLQTFDFPQFTVLRERDQRFVFPVKLALAAGSYSLRARVDVGTGEIQQVLTDFVVDRPSIDTARVQADYPVPIAPAR